VERIVVGMADLGIGSVPEQVLATYALGSCIGLAVHDRQAKVGGLLHFMLPDSNIDPERARSNPFMFADTGIPRLLAGVYALGASKRRLVVSAVGAASMVDAANVFDIGRRNYQAARRLLWKAGILLHGEAVGGATSRTVRLEIATGRLWVDEGGSSRELVPAAGGLVGGAMPAEAAKGGDQWRSGF
jgi:chemotaxis protein CheD